MLNLLHIEHAHGAGTIFDVLVETFVDTLKTLPILLIVYIIIEIIENSFRAKDWITSKLDKFGPTFGALIGSIPQCGFSAASASLYNSKIIGGATLIAVFLSTSDEAIPIILSHSSDLKLILYLIFYKIIIAIAAGYLLKYTVFKHEVLSVPKNEVSMECDVLCSCNHHHHDSGNKAFNIFYAAAMHTIKISVFILATLAVINSIMFFAGEENIKHFLLHGSFFQPLLTAFIGLIPGCATSVAITELLLNGSISFGAAIAGLSTGAGLGLIVLFREKRNFKSNLKILLYLYIMGSLAGLIVQFIH